MTKVSSRIATVAALTLTLMLGSARAASACSPPFNPTIRALGPAQVVVLGTTGERVATGRLFHVERAWNGIATTPIVIAFKEGEPIGDCSYPMESGVHLIIAPWREANGSLSADLGTLQADPASVAGRAYVAEAESLFGRGVVPIAVASDPSVETPTTPAVPAVDLRPVAIGLLAGVVLFALVIAIARRRGGAHQGD